MAITQIPLERLREFYMDRTARRLAEYGITEQPDQFVDGLVEVFHALYPAFTIDELLVRPREALKYCDAVREKCRNVDLPDDVILRLLLKRRKEG